MENVLVSVIVPVYNVEKDLEKCIKSILNQSHKNIEILLIDDGSIDSSGQICKSFQNSDKRIHYYYHDNKGVSFTRNKGVKLSKGKWICFVDSDDSVTEDYVFKLLDDTLDREKCDLVIHGINILDSLSKKSLIVHPVNNRVYELGNDNEFLRDVPILCLASPISKLFKKSIIVENNIFFDLSLNIGEDYLFTVEYLCNVSNVLTNPLSNYTYFRSSGSLSTTYDSFEGEVLAELTLYKATLQLSEKLNIDKKLIKSLYNKEFKKHAYRILFSLYKNRSVDYTKKDRCILFNSLDYYQLSRLKKMFFQNGLSGKLISVFFSKSLFFITDEFFKYFVNKKIN